MQIYGRMNLLTGNSNVPYIVKLYLPSFEFSHVIHMYKLTFDTNDMECTLQIEILLVKYIY